ncbi:MAG TPA: hypothetical protein VFF74_04715, partial [Methylophilaceae bacterium]|nr:hypothetical protein [Methylophilaceae bacterium]
TVSVDRRDASAEASRFLDQLQLPSHERWQFAAADHDRLRYSVDRQWYGELPRSYFYDATHKVQALSGRPKAEWLERWLQNIR